MSENLWAIIGIIVIWYLIQVVIYFCTELDIFWTILEEGYAVPVMRNKIFHKMILSFTGYHFAHYQTGETYDNLDDYNISRASSSIVSPRTFGALLLSILFPMRGIIWVGIPGVFNVSNKKIQVTRTAYEVNLEKVLLAGGMSLNVQLSVVRQIMNPAKALFRVNDYLSTSDQYLESSIRREFANLSVYDFVPKTPVSTETPANPVIESRLDSALSKILTQSRRLNSDYGIIFHRVQVQNYQPANGLTAKLIVQLTEIKIAADAAIAAAQGAAEVTRIQAVAEAAAMRVINAAAEEMGPNAMHLKDLHALENMRGNLTIIGSDVKLPMILPVSTTKGGSE